MKPPAFEYIAATSLEHALLLLDEHGDEAKVMAGGQSLMPMMNFRLVQPSLIVDISRIPGLDSIEEIGDALHIGALTRHVHLMTAPLVIEHFPIISEAMRHVAHTAIRNRGTIGGSLSHADPAAELPMIAMLLDAKMLIVNKDGRRTVDARDFFVGPLTTVLSGTEFLVAIEFPFLPARTEWAFEEVARRSGDFALAAVGVALEIRDEVVSNVRIAVTGVGEIPLRLQGV
ncbi:MAG: xanthine dehydrogenase family protein subunit M, partial [Pseudomonadota bacterium]